MGNRINPSARFDRERKRAKQDETSRQQQVQEAIGRKFASQGMTGSGESLKVSQQATDEGARRTDERMEGIASAEEESAFQQQQIEDQRKFQTSERVGSQQFASDQQAIGREFSTGEREASQLFASEESKLGRDQQAAQFAEQMGLSVD